MRALTDDFGTHSLGFLAGEGRGKTSGNNIDQDWLWCKCSDGRSEEFFGLNTLNEAYIGTSIGRKFQTGNSFFHAQNLSRVRTTDDNLRWELLSDGSIGSVNDTYEVRATRDRVTSNDGRADARQELLARNNLLAHQMAASFGLDLIFNVEASNASCDVLSHGAGDVGGPTKARKGGWGKINDGLLRGG